MTRVLSIARGACACALAVAALVVATASGQPGLPSGSPRTVVQDTGLPGVDRGLAALEAPQEPFGRGTRGLALVERFDGLEPRGPHLMGSVIVKFRSGAGQNGIASAMQQVDATRHARPSYADFEILDIPDDADPEAVCAELRQRPDVEYAQPRYLNYPMFRPNDEFYEHQWNFHTIDMERAWEIQPGASPDIVVAVLDTGVAFRTMMVRFTSEFPFRPEPGDPLFPALGEVDVPFAVAPELGDTRFVAPYDFIWEDDLPLDLDGHGTHVSGTIGQLTNNGIGVAGMAFNVRIMPVKVIQETWDFVFGSPNSGSDDVVARGIRYAADNGAHVINMSIGRTGGGPATAIEEAIRYAVSRGAFVAIAAGNTGDADNAPNRPAEASPNIAGMVAVASVGRALERAFYSTANAYVGLAAPGGDQRRDGGPGGILQQTLDQDLLHTYLQGPQNVGAPRADMFRYYFFQGTSMATPHVAGFAALLRQQGIRSPAAIEAAMKQFARDLGPPGPDHEYGHGLIQPRTTLRGLGLAR